MQIAKSELLLTKVRGWSEWGGWGVSWRERGWEVGSWAIWGQSGIGGWGTRATGKIIRVHAKVILLNMAP